MTLPILWTQDELSAALSVPVTGQLAITGVSIDSRKINPGDLFVALRGPLFDGHDFVAEAASKGAVAAIVSHTPSMLPKNMVLIHVADTQNALVDMAKFSRQRLRGKIIGITGSVGKTGTKEALRHALSRQGKTFASEGNLNNHIGLPLSLCRMPADTDYAIIEMGMNHPGEIAPLSKLCQPYVGIITAIAPAHIEFFPNGIEGIADEKAEILAGMGPQSVAIFNRDTPLFDRLARRAEQARIGRIIGFGSDPTAQARLLNCNLKPASTDVEADIMGHILHYSIGIPGRHIAVNSLAVLAAIQAVGADLQKAADSLKDLKPQPGRGLRRDIALSGGKVELIDESYNASPDSIRAALDVLHHAAIMPNGRRIAVLGDMLELGQKSAELHTGLAQAVIDSGVDLVFLCGPHMKNLHQQLQSRMKTHYTPDSAQLAPLVTRETKPGDVIMVKGSFGSKMRLVIEALDQLGYQNNTASPQSPKITA